jgi:hypothetical protein
MVVLQSLGGGGRQDGEAGFRSVRYGCREPGRDESAVELWCFEVGRDDADGARVLQCCVHGRDRRGGRVVGCLDSHLSVTAQGPGGWYVRVEVLQKAVGELGDGTGDAESCGQWGDDGV